jgi:hypothetical protein
LGRGEEDARRGQKLLKKRDALTYQREQNGQNCWRRELVIGQIATSASTLRDSNPIANRG